jgi:ATP-binding cassette subfamily C protein
MLARPFIDLVWQEPSLRRGLVVCVILALIASIAEVAVALALVPILVSLGVGEGSEIPSSIALIPPAYWLIGFAALAILRTIANWRSSVQNQRSTQELAVLMQSRIYRALSTAHWDTVRRLSPSTITSALQTQAYDASWGFSGLINVVTSVFLVAAYVVSAVFVFPVILLALAPLLTLMWWSNAYRSQEVSSLSDDYVDAQTDLHQRYEDWVAISRIASLGVDTKALAGRFEDRTREAAGHAVGFTRSMARTRASYEAAVLVAVLIGVPIAWWQDFAPALLAYGLLVLVRVLPRAGSIQVGYQGLVSAVAPVQAIGKLVAQLESGPAQAPADKNSRLSWQQLRLDAAGVEDTVREDGHRWILRDINLSLAHGEWLALTGPTGVGKTTLAEVMLMLVRPDAGRIAIDDQPIDEALAGAWRNQAAYVPQDVVLFDASIRDNLRLYVPDASDAELETALRQSAAEFVMDRLPEGLDTRAGPGGRWLSGGERQRIGIARALLRKPGFLVLDEPTAALDGDTQAKLMDALSNLEHTMSVVLITHRPELLILTDRVIEMKDGEIRC